MSRRVITIEYLDAVLEVCAGDATQEWVLRLASLVKSAAVRTGALAPTFVEEWLEKSAGAPTDALGLPDMELKASRSARRLLSDMVKDESGTLTFSELIAVVRGR